MKFVSLCLFLPVLLSAQTDSLPPQAIAPVTITATRLTGDPLRMPFAVSILDKSRLQSLQQALSAYDVLATVPGVFVQNPDNFSQDLRISIRGFGARAAFGIRGIRIVTDGIPESTPDGQADVDNLDVGVLQSMEVLRGAASALYGNAAGGVIYFKTEDPVQPFGEMLVEQGSYGFQRYQAKAGLRKRKWGTSFSIGYNRSAGYREQAAMRQLIVNNKWLLDLSPKTRVKWLLNYGNSPQAEDPGGLTAEQVAANRRQARPQNVQFDAGETVAQGRVGLIVEQRLDDRQQLTLRGFLTARTFGNRLAFQNGGTVEIDRLFGGGGLQYELRARLFHRPYRLQTGLDLDRQRDHRRRFNNVLGSKGATTLDQQEKFESLGWYAVHALDLAEKWSLTASTRLDRVRLAVDDRFRNDGDQSDALPLTRFSPLAGLSFHWNARSAVYVNAGSGFEAPTLNELSANPTETGGFNPDLKPQQSWNAETGLKIRPVTPLRLEAAVFFIGLRDEFVPYQLAQFPGRSFYRNAGRSERKGLEANVLWTIRRDMTLTANYTYSDFRYTEYESGNLDFSKNRTPGIPQHLFFGEWRWQSASGFMGLVQLRYVDGFYADDANTARNDAYTLASLRAGYHRKFKRGWIEPFVGVNNLFEAAYNANVLLNAAGNRFYEPGAGRYFFGGIKVGVSR